MSLTNLCRPTCSLYVYGLVKAMIDLNDLKKKFVRNYQVCLLYYLRSSCACMLSLKCDAVSNKLQSVLIFYSICYDNNKRKQNGDRFRHCKYKHSIMATSLGTPC